MKIKELLKQDWAIYIFLLLPFIMILIFWEKYPPQIPMHWSFSGTIDRYESKMPGLFFIPGFNIFLYILFLVIPKIDPKWDNFKLFKKTYQIVKYSIILFMTFLFFVITATCFGYKFDTMYAVTIPIIIFIAIFGNIMGNIRQNYFVGIRLPWTLSNEQVWTITHRMAGHLWVWSSIIMIILIVMLPSNIIKYGFWVYIGTIVIVPGVYSYIVYKRINKNSGRVDLIE